MRHNSRIAKDKEALKLELNACMMDWWANLSVIHINDCLICTAGFTFHLSRQAFGKKALVAIAGTRPKVKTISRRLTGCTASGLVISTAAGCW